MGRVKLEFPSHKPLFTATIPVRITDINYGGHMGNDALLSVLHEARMQMLHSWGYADEINAGGSSMIMADVMIAYKAEAYYGDLLNVHLYASEITSRSFALLYHVTAIRSNQPLSIAHAKTGMVCYDYQARNIVPMGDELKLHLIKELD